MTAIKQFRGISIVLPFHLTKGGHPAALTST